MVSDVIYHACVKSSHFEQSLGKYSQQWIAEEL